MLPRYSKLLSSNLTVNLVIEAEVVVDTWRYTPKGLTDALKRSIEKLGKLGLTALFQQKDAVTFLLFAFPKNIHDIPGLEEAYREIQKVNNLEA